MERQSWHGATVVTAWASYTWMGFLFLFFCIGLTFDLGHALAALLSFKWPLNDAAAFRAVGLLALAALGYGLIEARQIQVEQINITTPKLTSGRVTIAQISDLHLGMMTGMNFPPCDGQTARDQARHHRGDRRHRRWTRGRS